ncbi:MAG: carboxypeptidase regulatory-like domain-containing protein [Gemmatimonadota bacterium]
MSPGRGRGPGAPQRGPRRTRDAVLSLCLGWLLVLASAQAALLLAQDTKSPQPQPGSKAALIGQVVSASNGKGLEGAVVNLIGSGYGAITDSTGHFRIPQTLAGTEVVEVRFIGYDPSRLQLDLAPNKTTRVVLLLSPTVVRVAELHVEVERTRRSAKMAGFEKRRSVGFGHFFTPEDIAARHPRLPSDLIRTVPGVYVGPIRFGKAQVFLDRSHRCKPAVYLDGVYQGRLDVDDIPPEDLGAMEVYKGVSETPAEYARLNNCGVILIWTPEGFGPDVKKR